MSHSTNCFKKNTDRIFICSFTVEMRSLNLIPALIYLYTINQNPPSPCRHLPLEGELAAWKIYVSAGIESV